MAIGVDRRQALILLSGRQSRLHVSFDLFHNFLGRLLYLLNLFTHPFSNFAPFPVHTTVFEEHPRLVG